MESSRIFSKCVERDVRMCWKSRSEKTTSSSKFILKLMANGMLNNK